MKTLIHEIGIIDKLGTKHPVKFNTGLNVVTGKSSTGKSALIEIFDYCFGNKENTVPKGVITDNAKFYYVVMTIKDKNIIIARDPENTKTFYKILDEINEGEINCDFFSDKYFIYLEDFKKIIRSNFLDIDDVDESLIAREKRGKKANTPSIRSFTSFILQHQNLIANKHALFYRFDEKEKRDQVIDHTKIFLGMVDQEYFHLSQENERLTGELNGLNRQKDTKKRISENNKEKIEPILNSLYALMGFKEAPLTIANILLSPENAKDQLDKIIILGKIDYTSDASAQRYKELNSARASKVIELRRLHRKAKSIEKNIKSEEQMVENINQFESSEQQVNISALVCPFCHTTKNELAENAQKLKHAIYAISENLNSANPMKAKLESYLVETKREIERLNSEIDNLTTQIDEMDKIEQKLSDQKSLYEEILMAKARLYAALDSLNLSNDTELEQKIKKLKEELKIITKKLNEYDVKKELKEASEKVNVYMNDIGEHFDFEASYMPINLHFSFESFDLYHLTDKDEKVFLRTMGSGANWLYSHVSLFLALHKYFAELGDKCSIPSILFFDQPTQVYFPNFNRDNSSDFAEQKAKEEEQRKDANIHKNVDEDIKSVENLFSQLAIYCNDLEKSNGFSPQIIVTDHADNLTLTNGVSFESLVNGNRWRIRGLIDPVPSKS